MGLHPIVVEIAMFAATLTADNAGIRSSPVLRRTDSCQVCAARALSLCNALADEDIRHIAQIAAKLRFEPGRMIVAEGDPSTHLFSITEGAAKIYKLLPDGRRQITGFLFPGDLIGLAFNDTYAYSAEALAPLTVCRFSRRSVEGLLDEFPKMERRLMRMATHELVAAQEQFMLLGRKTARERIASFLLVLSDRERRLGNTGGEITLVMTRTDIADYLGLTTETVSRTLTRLKVQRCITLRPGNQVALLDREGLQGIAGGLA